MTKYILISGGNLAPETRREFTDLNDASFRAAQMIVGWEASNATHAYVQLMNADNDQTIIGWTKTSNERPTSEGVLLTR